MIDPMREPLEGERKFPFGEGDAFFEPGAASKILVIGAVEVIDAIPTRPSRAAAGEISRHALWPHPLRCDQGQFRRVHPGFRPTNVKAGATLLTDGHAPYSAIRGYRHDPRVVGKVAGHVALPWISSGLCAHEAMGPWHVSWSASQARGQLSQ
jgi:hypothetical protein